MSNVHAFNVASLMAISLLMTTVSELLPPLESVEIVVQLPADLQVFNDSNETSNEAMMIPKGYDTLEQAIFFKFYKNGKFTYLANGVNVERLENTGCEASDRFAFLLHGWRENCEVDWMKLLIDKLTVHRGGCIVCIDYGLLSQDPYVRLLRKFNPISAIMTEKLKYLNFQGMDPGKVYMFGFSYGGQLAAAIGKYYGDRQIKEIDTCDMAGPGFDFKLSSLDHRGAAQNIQCIHTSRDKGTKSYECDQNWRMGNCGLSQDAAEDPPKGSHGLCPYFYVSAFEHPFYAVEKPNQCASRRPAISWPEDFQMGYMESRKLMVSGELFAITSDAFPFNVLDKNITLDDISPGRAFVLPRFRGLAPVANAVKRARGLFFQRRRNFWVN